jgi:ATP-dependent DNA ligase
LLATSLVRRVHFARIVHVATGGQTSVPWDLRAIVSKRLTTPYRSGPSRDWLKVKNPDSPAMIRAREAEWS